jgi:predicted dehydrogenase
VVSEVGIWTEFARAVREGGTPAVTPRSVLGTMAILDAARESSGGGRVVEVEGLVEWVY